MKSLLIKEGCREEDLATDLMDLLKLGINAVECVFEVACALEKLKKYRYENVICDTNIFDIFKNFGALEVIRGNDGRIIGLLK